MYKKGILNFGMLVILVIIPNIIFYIQIQEFRTTILCSNLNLIVLILLFNKNKYTRILCFFGLFLFVVNNVIAVFNVIYFTDLFNTSLALSFFSTHLREALEMTKEYYPVLVFAAFYFAALLFLIRKQSVRNINFRWLIAVFILTILLPVFRLYHEYRVTTDFDLMRGSKTALYLKCTPIYAFAPFVEANLFLKDVKYLENKNFTYPSFKTRPNDLENIVVVIGESICRNAMSLYGNRQKTTPLLDNRVDNLYIYNQAVSTSSFTATAVTFLLSKQLPTDEFKIEDNLDNIISLANATDIWETYWLSTQENIGVFVNLFSMISHKAIHKKWIHNARFDEEIIPEYNKVLQDSIKKRLIFIHINGSHPVFSERYPKEFNQFKENKQYINEYYNSVYYTDYVLDKLIELLEKTNSLLLYVGDHGLEDRGNKLVHSTTKSSVEVPFFIWYSNYVSNNLKQIGRNDNFFSTSNLYNVLMDYMGIEGVEYKNENRELKIMTPDFLTTRYGELKNGS